MRRTERVFVENLGIHGFHGLIDEEKRLGQKFYADIECLVARDEAPSDTMKDAVDYGKICDLAHNISASGPFNLIETLAERIGHGVDGDVSAGLDGARAHPQAERADPAFP